MYFAGECENTNMKICEHVDMYREIHELQNEPRLSQSDVIEDFRTLEENKGQSKGLFD